MFKTACFCVCVCGGGPTTMFTTACHCVCVWWGPHYHVHNSVSPCVCVCMCWRAYYHVYNSLSLCVCVFEAHYHVHNSLSLCVCVCGGGHISMFTTACHYVCVCWRAHYHVHNSLSLCVCVVGGTLPCSQQPASHCYLVPGESSLHPAFKFKILSTNLCQSLLPSLETSREEL